MATATFVFVLVAANVLQQVSQAIASGRVTPAEGFQLIVLLFPTVIPYALPMGALTGVLITFGRLSAEGEITAMKAAGISLTRIARPVLIGAALVALGSAWLNLEAGPASEDEFEVILAGATKNNPANMIVPGETNRRFPNLMMKARDRQGEKLIDFWVWELDAKGQIIQSVFAKEARLIYLQHEQGEDILRVELKQTRMETRQPSELGTPAPASYSTAAAATLEFPAGKVMPSKNGYYKRLRMMTGRELWAASQEGWQVPAGATPEVIAHQKMLPLVQLMARLTTAVSVFTLVFLAIPLAVTVGRAESSVNAPLALLVALSYYALTQAAGWVKDPEWHPELLVWVPNITVIILSIFLLRRAAKH
jgi:lipopolysaccharide export system permease protein